MVVPIVTNAQIDASDFTGARTRILQPCHAISQNYGYYSIAMESLKGSLTGANIFWFPLDLPDGCALNTILLNCYCEVGSQLDYAVYKVTKAGSSSAVVAQASAGTTGAQEITLNCGNITIDNTAYYYVMYIILTPATSINNCYFISAPVNYTLTHPKP